MANNEEKELLKKARKGNVEAMFELANLYSFEGKNDKAQMWYKKASKRGHAGAKRSKRGFRLPRRSLEDKCGCGCFICVLLLIVLILLCMVFPSVWYFGKYILIGLVAIIGILLSLLAYDSR